jgi:RNA polymerase subunit RPABC4/transcription elongation factor Spt4
MNVASRPVSPGKTRTCPHCKAAILESLSICPGCIIRHPALQEAWEYFVVIAVRNDRGEEVTRQVVNVGALAGTEKRTFTLSVEVLPPQTPSGGPAKPANGTVLKR